MDRPVSTTGALPPGLEDASSSGWDPHTVWEERVRGPRLQAQRTAPASTPGRDERAASGTLRDAWRLRVGPLRKNPA